jgi:hypothetical protein
MAGLQIHRVKMMVGGTEFKAVPWAGRSIASAGHITLDTPEVVVGLA